MAKENIARFFEAAMTDKTLAGKVAALAVENGCPFTAGEFLEIGEASPLSDEELGDASGGKLAIHLPKCGKELPKIKNTLLVTPTPGSTLSGGPIKGDPFNDTHLV